MHERYRGEHSDRMQPAIGNLKKSLVFRSYLALQGYVANQSYCWAGEPLYRGDPIEPKAAAGEARAIAQTYQWIADHEPPRETDPRVLARHLIHLDFYTENLIECASNVERCHDLRTARNARLQLIETTFYPLSLLL